MTEHDHEPEHDGVRRLLADVPAPGLPDDVAARLDARLAALVAERDAPPSAPVADLAAERAARRRSRIRVGVVAAASVAVVGLGIGTVASNLTTGASDESTAGAAADQGDTSMLREVPEPEAAQSEQDAPRVYGGDDAGGAEAAVTRPVVHAATLERDVARLFAQRSARRDTANGVLPPSAAAKALAPCVVPSLGAGDDAVPVRYDGKDATLVFRAPADGAREAQVYACGDGGTPVAATAVPSR